MSTYAIRPARPGDLDDLIALTLDVVEAGASVGFMWPLAPERGRAFWQDALADHARGDRHIVVAEQGGRVVGTVQLALKMPDNQPHRADVAKLQVHRCARRQGLGAALVGAIEEAAWAAGRTVLVLDTVTGSPAEALYAGLGWRRVGEIPDYALWPDGRPCPTTIFYKRRAS